ncbi:MAG: PDZ domain-containing protein [Planctomycetota bacterium]
MRKSVAFQDSRRTSEERMVNGVSCRRAIFALAIICTLIWGKMALAQQDSASLKYRQAMAKAVRDAAGSVLDSVVSIEVIGIAETAPGRGATSEVAGDAPTCGVIIDERGYIIASDIVLRRPAATILVVLPNGDRVTAEQVARDTHRGLVLLKIETKEPLTVAQLPDSVEVPVGSTVVAVARYGETFTPLVSSGILSATERLEGTMLQCDARVSPAFYGGPVVDLYGRVIGVSVPAVAEGGAPDSTSWYDSGIAFAVPAPVLKEKLSRLIEGETIRKGLIGIVPVTTDPYSEGTELASVRIRSPAERAGLKAGDVITSIAGRDVRRFQQIRQVLGRFDAGDTIKVSLERESSKLSFDVTLADSIPPLDPQRVGLWIQEQSSDGDDDDRLIVSGVIPGSPADENLKPGDVIKSLDGTTVESAEGLSRRMVTAEPKRPIVWRVDRNGEELDVQTVPQPIAGPLLSETVPAWEPAKVENSWDAVELRLPDVSNLAAYVAPEPDETLSDRGLGLLVLLLAPKDRDAKAALEPWREAATAAGVVVLALCSEEEKQWQSKEIDVVARMTTLLAQRVPVGDAALATDGVLGNEPTAADTMVIAIALSDRKQFTGIAFSADSKPPAVRLRENEPDHSIRLMLPIESVEDGPTWLAPLKANGYPIVLGGTLGKADLLRWTRLLQTL